LRGAALEAGGDYRAAVEAYRRVGDAGLPTEVENAIERCCGRLGEAAAQGGAAGKAAGAVPEPGAGVSGASQPERQPVAMDAPRYRCEACGFASRKLFWQCPGCQCWSTVKPIRLGDVK
jgi:lipopolysaccharide biosynthesis regulator YciM